MYRYLLIKLNSKEIFQFCKGSIQCLNVFRKVLEDHRIPTNIDVKERLWTGRFGANRASLKFICRNRFLHLGKTVKLWTYWMYFSIKFFPFYLLSMKKKTNVMKSLSICFGHHSLAFLNSFWNILNKYHILVLNKYNLEYVTCNILGAEGRRDGGWGPRGRGPKNTDNLIRNGLAKKMMILLEAVARSCSQK